MIKLFSVFDPKTTEVNRSLCHLRDIWIWLHRLFFFFFPCLLGCEFNKTVSFALGRLFSQLEIFSVKKDGAGKRRRSWSREQNKSCAFLWSFQQFSACFPFVRVPNVWSATQSRTQPFALLSQMQLLVVYDTFLLSWKTWLYMKSRLQTIPLVYKASVCVT